MICNSKKLLIDAINNHYAVPAFNIHNLETMRACVETCYEMRSPVILSFTPKTMALSHPSLLQAIAQSASKIYDIPICLHLDHFKKIDDIIFCLELGIKSVMLDNSFLPLHENITNTIKVVNLARKYDATVEGEVGCLQRNINDQLVKGEEFSQVSDPNEVVEYIQKTNVDSCAVSFGNIHGKYLTPPKLNFNILVKILKLFKEKAIFNFPLVLHGGSGLNEQQIANIITHGFGKINIGSELKPVFVNALKNILNTKKTNDLREILPEPVNALKETIKAKVLLCKSFNKY